MNHQTRGPEQAKLAQLMKILIQRSKAIIRIENLDENNAELFLVNGSFNRLALSYGHAISVLLSMDMWDATAPLERALYEVWAESKYIMNSDHPRDSAIKTIFTALFEMRDYLNKYGNSDDTDSIDYIQSIISKYSQKFPGPHSIICEQRARKQFHWSGLSRTKVIKSVFDDDAVYKPLSWGAHAVLTPFIDWQYKDDAGSGKLNFAPAQDSYDESERIAYHVGGIVYYMWNAHAAKFGIAPIRLNEEGDPIAGL